MATIQPIEFPQDIELEKLARGERKAIISDSHCTIHFPAGERGDISKPITIEIAVKIERTVAVDIKVTKSAAINV